MIQKICIAIVVLLCSCKQNKTEEKETSQKSSTSKIDTLKSNNTFYTNINWLKNIPKDSITEMYWKEIIKRDSLNKQFKHALASSYPLKDKTVNFLWIEKKFHPTINGKYCETISEPERAALGYLTILNGTLNYCHYNIDPNKEYTMRHALNIDSENDEHYDKCTEQFMSYMQFWFREDAESLQTIKEDHCETPIHAGQSVYDYFSKINLTVKGNKIYIYFKATSSIRSDYDVNWTEKLTFLVGKDYIKLIEEKELDEEYIYYYPNGSGIVPPKGYKDNGHGEYRLPKKSKKK